MRIATKLVAGLSLGMLLILALHGYVSYQHKAETLERDSEREGQRLAQLMALAMAREWDTQGKDAALAMVESVNEMDRDVALHWDPESDLTALSAGKTELLRAGRPVSILGSADELVSLNLVPSSQRLASRGLIRVEHPLSEDRQRLLSTLQALLAAVVLMLLVAALMATVLSRRWVTKPAKALLARASAIGNGELDGEVTMPESTALEFVELAEAMNDMAVSLRRLNERREREEARRRSVQDQLWHAERLITAGKLAAGIAHELGTPLNVISGHALMIVRDQVHGSEIVDSARTIHRQTEHISSIIQQLLGFARRKGAAVSKCDITGLCVESLELIEPMARKADVDLVRTGPQLDAMVDPGLFQQVVTNLLTNAVQAMPDGGRVLVALDRVEAMPPRADGDTNAVDCIRLRVEDCGIGIEDANQSRIFEPFFTTKDVGQGTGLGLAAVHGIVQEHDGWIKVDSSPGQGTVFTVYLPQAPDDGDQVQEQDGPHRR